MYSSYYSFNGHTLQSYDYYIITIVVMTKYVIVQKLLKLLTISVYIYHDVIVYYSSYYHDLTQMSVKQNIKKISCHTTLFMCT